MAAKAISQKEYLKRYLSGDKKKKKKVKKHAHSNLRIIDDNEVVLNQEEVDEELLLGGDDAPVIVAEYIEDAKNIKRKWRSIGAVIKEEEKEEDTPTSDTTAATNSQRMKIEIKKEPRGSAEHESICASRQMSFPALANIKIERRSPTEDQSPQRPDQNTRHRSISSDLSPPRSQRKQAKENTSRHRHSQSPDLSPPRKLKHPADDPMRKCRLPSSDLSPPRRHRKPTDGASSRRFSCSSDISPPRRHKKVADERRERRRSPRSAYQSPVRRQKTENSRRSISSDLVPHRKHKKSNRRSASSSDISPPRRTTKKASRHRSVSSDLSPPREHKRDAEVDRKRQRSSSSDQSPPRRHRKETNVSSRTRQREHTLTRRIKQEDEANPKLKRRSRSSDLTPLKAAIKREKERKLSPRLTQLPAFGLQAHAKSRSQSPDRSIKMSFNPQRYDEQVQVRKTGYRGARARAAAEEDPARLAAEQKVKEKYERWGKGLKQLEDRDARIAEMAHEANKPLARYANDDDLDRLLRDKECADDPMLEYMRAKKKDKHKAEPSAAEEKPIYKGLYPENRFAIRPGHRWDGVDRSNGYEKRWFKVRSDRVALQEEAYKYSVADM